VRRMLTMATGENEGALREALLGYVRDVEGPVASLVVADPSIAGGNGRLGGATGQPAAAVGASSQ